VVALSLAVVFALIAKNLVRGRVGRSWMAIRDRDIAAEIIGIRPLPTKLLAFAISSFYCGWPAPSSCFLPRERRDPGLRHHAVVHGAIHGDHRRPGQHSRSFLGAAFIVLVPIFLTNAPHLLHVPLPVALQKQIELMVFER
jgi:branched-chain amino acid transport system permease protein